MKKVHSHYENLKVSRDAPPEVIRAAYRSLSQMYHPDRNPGNSDATRIMAVLNVAFETLSDPEKRKVHDQWIAIAEREPSVSQPQPNTANSSKGNSAFTVDETKFGQTAKRPTAYEKGKSFASSLRDPNLPRLKKLGLIIEHLIRNWFWYAIGVLIIVSALPDKPSTSPPGPKPYVSTPAPVRNPSYVRPNMAPNGEPWPITSGYISGYPQLHHNGLSTVTIDNSQNDTDVLVKLVSLTGTQAYPVRTFFISAHDKFIIDHVTIGNYDIRYRDLSTGGLSRSEPFDLTETRIDNGTQFSTITMTLYKVRNGNMQTYDLAEGEF